VRYSRFGIIVFPEDLKNRFFFTLNTELTNNMLQEQVATVRLQHEE